MNENEFEIDGKVYVEVPIVAYSCNGCAFDTHVIATNDCLKAKCNGRKVIFVEVQDERAKR